MQLRHALRYALYAPRYAPRYALHHAPRHLGLPLALSRGYTSPESQLKAIRALVNSTLPHRHGFGAAGDRLNVTTNSLVYDLEAFKIYTCALAFPKNLKKQLQHELLQNLSKQLKTPGYNNSLYSLEPLPARSFECTAGGNTYPVTIASSSTLDVKSLIETCNIKQKKPKKLTPLLSALDILLTSRILSSTPHAVRLAANKIALVKPFAGENAIDRGLYLCPGYHLSVRPAYPRALVTIRRTAAAFYKAHNKDGSKMTFVDYLDEYMGYPFRKEPRNIHKLKNNPFFTGIKISRQHLPHSLPKTIRAISAKTAKSSFTRNNAEISFEEYYKQQYGLSLSYPDLPLLHFGGTNYLPPELALILPNQPFKAKLDDTPTLLAFTKRPAAEMASLLKSEILPKVQAADPRIEKNLMVVPGRILPAPTIQYKNKLISFSPASPASKGAWDLKGCEFMVLGKAKPNCAFIVVTDRTCKLNATLKEALGAFFAQLKGCGLDFQQQTIVEVPHTDPRALDKLEKQVAAVCRNLSNCNYALVVLPRKNTKIYEAVKRATDQRAGINSNCAVAQRLAKKKNGFDQQYFRNIAMKVNLKLGGSNHVLGKPDALQDTMLMGADVTHPDPRSKQGSLAAVVASQDKHLSNFPGSLRTQKAKQEMIAEMEAMTTERLLHYFNINKKMPSRIIFYRDGVSESQFAQVVETELSQIKNAIKSACKELRAPIPKLTLVCTIKQTSARFFPHDKVTAERNPAIAKDNVAPGLTVDTSITSPHLFDFYIQSQQMPQDGATASPTHYQVLYDDNGFGADEIQKITYDLCHIFSRSTSAVKVCPPAYYADLLCTRGRCYTGTLAVNPGVENTMYYI